MPVTPLGVTRPLNVVLNGCLLTPTPSRSADSTPSGAASPSNVQVLSSGLNSTMARRSTRLARLATQPGFSGAGVRAPNQRPSASRPAGAVQDARVASNARSSTDVGTREVRSGLKVRQWTGPLLRCQRLAHCGVGLVQNEIEKLGMRHTRPARLRYAANSQAAGQPWGGRCRTVPKLTQLAPSRAMLAWFRDCGQRHAIEEKHRRRAVRRSHGEKAGHLEGTGGGELHTSRCHRPTPS